MSGIAGTYAPPGRIAPRELLLAMAGELRHRGPDGTGLYLDDRFGMVHTRLTPPGGEGTSQPQGTADGRYWVVLDGEIHDAPELRRQLAATGRSFLTRSSAEVAAHAYDRWGPAGLHRLEGEFALALWDRERRELFLARDRFGIRPLYLSTAGGSLSFASEARALLRHPAATRELDPASLVETFTLWAVSPDRSAFRGIRELPPGTYLRLGPRGPASERRWWDIAFTPANSSESERPEALAGELLALLEDSVRARLGDGGVACYLSGGLDSSAVAALAARHSPAPLRGFAVGFSDARFDESPYQDRVAYELGIELTRIVVGSREIADALPRAVVMAEKPLLRTAPAPLSLLAAEARAAGFSAVLTGEGADELFAGYDIFQEAAVRRFWARRPESALRPQLLRRLYPYLAESPGRAGGFWQAFFAAGLTDTSDPLYSHRIRFRNTARGLRFLSRAALLAAEEGGAPEERLLASLPDEFARWGPLGQAQYLEIRTFLQGYLLHSQGDRVLMGNSVEGRFPFLDRRLAGFAAGLPEQLRLRGLRDKYLLRQAVAPLLPAAILARPKLPYRAPIAAAFTGPGAPEYVRELLDPARLDATGLFDGARVARLLAKAEGIGLGETDEMALVGALSTMLLHELMIERPTLAPAAVPDLTVVAGGAREATLARATEGA